MPSKNVDSSVNDVIERATRRRPVVKAVHTQPRGDGLTFDDAQQHPVAFLLDDLQSWLRARSRAQLARAIGVSPAELSLLGRGLRRLTPEFLIRVARALETRRG